MCRKADIPGSQQIVMRAIPRRRMLRVVTLALLPFVLSASYVGSWLGVSWMVGRRWLPDKTYLWTSRTLFQPLEMWKQGGLSGADTLKAWQSWAYYDGYFAMRDANRHRRFPAAPGSARVNDN